MDMGLPLLFFIIICKFLFNRVNTSNELLKKYYLVSEQRVEVDTLVEADNPAEVDNFAEDLHSDTVDYQPEHHNLQVAAVVHLEEDTDLVEVLLKVEASRNQAADNYCVSQSSAVARSYPECQLDILEAGWEDTALAEDTNRFEEDIVQDTVHLVGSHVGDMAVEPLLAVGDLEVDGNLPAAGD